MDVRTLLLCLFLALTACGSSTNSQPSSEKATDASCGGAALTDQKIVRWKDGRFTKYKLKELQQKKFDHFVESNKEKIDYIESDFKIPKPLPATVSLFNDNPWKWGGYPNWGIDAISAKALWNQNIFGENITVAIIDSGIDPQHPQIINQLYVNPKEIENGIDDDGNGLIDDIHGYDFPNQSGHLSDSSRHGTHVAGIIAADHANGDIKGVAPKAKLLVYDFMEDDGGTVFDAIAAIRAAESQGAKVINASWGGPGCSRSLHQAIDELAQKNILFVTASGNEYLNIDRTPTYPAAYELSSIITVGAMTVDNFTAEFSNVGRRKVHLVAPGVDILSTIPMPKGELIMDGTSMAAPFVSGAVALLWSAYPNATAKQIKDAILKSVKAGPHPVQSRGSLDVNSAHEALKKIMTR